MHSHCALPWSTNPIPFCLTSDLFTLLLPDSSVVYSCSPLPHSLYPVEETEICLFTKNDKKTTKELLEAKKVKGVAKVTLQTPPISGGGARWRRKGGKGEEGGGGERWRRRGGREWRERGEEGGGREGGAGAIYTVQLQCSMVDISIHVCISKQNSSLWYNGDVTGQWVIRCE